ncbi:MAG: hypothetical protein JWM80_1495, partial [Cyanobacteria bacterium RYN_339]|nr:hypothetical protein [Cyanobacteria bacterium RYN_339]
ILYPYEVAYSAAVLGKWPQPLAEDLPPPTHETTPLQRLVALFLGVSYAQAVAFPLLIWLGWRLVRRAGVLDPDARLLVIFLLGNIAWVTAASNFIEIGDNNRYRYDVDGFYLALLAMALQRLSARHSHG